MILSSYSSYELHSVICVLNEISHNVSKFVENGRHSISDSREYELPVNVDKSLSLANLLPQ